MALRCLSCSAAECSRLLLSRHSHHHDVFRPCRQKHKVWKPSSSRKPKACNKEQKSNPEAVSNATASEPRTHQALNVHVQERLALWGWQLPREVPVARKSY